MLPQKLDTCIHHSPTEGSIETANSVKDKWQETLTKGLEGDMEQLGCLFQEYLRPKIYSFALSLLNSQDDAEDVVQEVFAHLFSHYQMIQKRTLVSLETLVMVMVKGICRDQWKKKTPTESVTEDLATTTTPQEDFARKQMLVSLCTTIQQELTENEQTIFKMKVIDELPYRIIAEQMGMPLMTVHRTYRSILMKLEKQGFLHYWRSSL